MKKLTIFLLATLYLSSSVAGPVRLNIFKKRSKTQNVITVYDTVRVVVTDTIPLRAPEGTDTSKITVLSVAKVFAEVIDKVYNFRSISDAYGF